ncbi:MAG TPA: BON domain-containing protein [Burkholderiaceae bacterium]|nr:BON domain-containing protein [Burkholderiaceae bacterium]
MQGSKRLVIALLAIGTIGLSGCVGLAATGAAVGLGTVAALDRRTLGAQTEDQGLELRAVRALQDNVRHAGGISVTSYNRKVLLTGQVVDEQAKRDAERVIALLPNVRQVHNELEVSGRASVGTSAADAAITARVKTALLEDRTVPGSSVKVVTETSVVYLMGLVTEAEGRRAAEITSRTSGVRRVVTLYEYITEQEKQRLSLAPARR